MALTSRRGESFIELIAALVFIEVIGAAALAAGFTVERLSRHVTAGAADDASRWQEYRARESAPACIGASSPDTVALVFPRTADRPSLTTAIRCGR